MIFKHKGYTLQQEENDHHYMIFAEDGHRVMHAPCDQPMTEDKAIACIENYRHRQSISFGENSLIVVKKLCLKFLLERQRNGILKRELRTCLSR